MCAYVWGCSRGTNLAPLDRKFVTSFRKSCDVASALALSDFFFFFWCFDEHFYVAPFGEKQDDVTDASERLTLVD